MPLAATVLIVFVLYFAREVLIPIAVALLLTFVLAPMVGLLRRWRIPKVPATLIPVLLAISLFAGLGVALGTQVAQLAEDLPRYQMTIQKKLDTAQEMTIGRLSAFVERYGNRARATTDHKPAEQATNEPAPLAVQVKEPTLSPIDLAQRIVTPVIGPLTNLLIIIVVAIFGLLQRDDLRDRLIRLMGSGDLHRTTVAMDDAASRLSRYFLAQLALNFIFGVIVGVGLYSLGVPSPFVWGVMAMLLRFVPYVGAFMSAFPPILLAAAVDPGWSMVLWTGALFLASDLIIGQFVEPLVYGHSTGLSPLAVVLSAIFWTWLWGPMGLLLSTPLTLCVVVLGRHIDRLEFIDVMLGNRPALTPAQSFYQRMLAGDADSIVSYAETILKERPLSAYFDEVALEGLRLAAADHMRGVLDRAQVAMVNETIAQLVLDLEDYDDAPAGGKETAPASAAIDGNGAVLCVAGRGPFDISAARLLSQLLTKRARRTVVLDYAGVAYDAVKSITNVDIAAVCVCTISTSSTPQSTRAVIRRLRKHVPHVLYIAGFFPGQAAAVTDMSNAGDADHFVETLGDAARCLADAQMPADKPAQRLMQSA
ncbi:MAG: AI-2E family transporter [Beijerinckiaceae bacterium]|nr:AI-2E family transporter [Beijerinckiaceae bacterium]